jgi:arylsulfatase A-like enzyme
MEIRFNNNCQSSGVRLAGALLSVLPVMFTFGAEGKAPEKPNVILVITDDQGFGDLGFYGNPNIKTPVLDKFAKESVRFNQFFVSPVCSPTRSSVMTGRYSLRTGVRDTYKGGAIMATSEITIAEVLKHAGYQTGMIGKWHLGDNYPCRPQDQGFGYTLRHLSGGIGQAGDWPNALRGDSSYFNPTLWQNGEMVKSKGYCTDVFTDAAINFVRKNKEKPFFLYLAFNAPHGPLQVPMEYYEKYKDIDPSKGFGNDPRPFPKMDGVLKENARKVYAMVSNIDDNIGRLLKQLDELKLDKNTLVIFMTDNGPQHYRYLAGMRGLKGLVYQGGVRVPCFWRYPAGFQGNRDIETPSAHYDLLPTLAGLCGGKIPADRVIDGRSLLPLLKNELSELPNRAMCCYWERGYPEKYRNVSIRKGADKLVGNCGADDGIEQFELFDIKNDPYELNNIVSQNIQKGLNLRNEMSSWLDEMMLSPNIVLPPRAVLGTRHENPSRLNLNDVVSVKDEKLKNNVVSWKVEIAETGAYDLIVHFTKKNTGDAQIRYNFGVVEHTVNRNLSNNDILKIDNIQLPAGKADLSLNVCIKEANKDKYISPSYVEVGKRD